LEVGSWKWGVGRGELEEGRGKRKKLEIGRGKREVGRGKRKKSGVGGRVMKDCFRTVCRNIFWLWGLDYIRCKHFWNVFFTEVKS
jgi:hypothetical protein